MNHQPKPSDLQLATELRQEMQDVLTAIHSKVVGQQETLEQLLIALLAGGHCLLEGAPGLAKTLMVRSLSQAMHLKFSRVQFTPDLMPSDIIGTDIIQESHEHGGRKLVFQSGPIFTQILLADEINRTPPKTQAALLEAMQEHSVTVGRETYRLPEPFFVLATQNPIEQEGTYPLPEAQRDRFLLQIIVGYPSRQDESMIMDLTTGNIENEIEPMIEAEQLLRYQRLVRDVPLPDNVKNLILDFVRILRPSENDSPDWVKDCIQWGPGPRACQHLALAGKARALLKGRTVVSVADVQALALPVLRHRIVISFSASAQGLTPDAILTKAWTQVAPKQVNAL